MTGRIRKLWWRLVRWLLTLTLLLGVLWWALPRPQGTDPRRTGATLVEEPRSVVFDPGKGSGVRMRLDWVDVKHAAHAEFFRRNGWSNLSRDTRPTTDWLAATGFPTLHLAWPSLHLRDAWSCRAESESLADDCPVLTMELRSEPLRNAVERLQRGDVWQWTAFRTRGWNDRQWAGWQCDAQRQQAMNRAIGAPGAERREWAVHPLVLQPHCGVPKGFMERRLPWVAGLREHPVLWSCTKADDDNIQPTSGACRAVFEHRGRLVTLNLPGRAWIGDAEHRMPALLRLRPQLVEAAWRTLEDATAAAAHQTQVDWDGSLRTELGWCEAMSARVDALRRTGRVIDARNAWAEPDWRLSTVNLGGPCSRALHRVLRAWEQTPAQAKPAPLLVDAARRLAAIQTAEHPNLLSRPVWALNKELLVRQLGAGSLALLQWQAQQRYRELEPTEIIASYDALRDQVERLPAKERLALRQQLAQLASGDALAARRDELEWAFMRDWLANPAAAPLSRNEEMSRLLSSAQRARQRPREETRERLTLLLPAIQAQARSVAQDQDLLRTDRLVSVATLALHGAWHANWMAVNDGNGDPWRQWLVEHAAWSETVLPGTPGDWVAGVALHRDAARRGRLTEPDCPGGALLQCRWSYQMPAFVR